MDKTRNKPIEYDVRLTLSKPRGSNGYVRNDLETTAMNSGPSTLAI